MTETENVTNGKANDANGDGKADANLQAKIKRQVEFYFGDINLPRDKFLQEKVKEDEGWIPMETMLNFKRLSALSSEAEVIMEALKESDIIEVDLEKKRIRRDPKLEVPEYNDERKKEMMAMTVYCKGITKEDKLDEVMAFFEGKGQFSNIHMRTFLNRKDNSKGFKGSVFVTFKSKEEAEKFLALDKVEYKGNDLMRKWQETYFEDKKKEVEEKRKEKENFKKEKLEKKKARQKEEDEEKPEVEKSEVEKPELPKGTVLHITGIGKDTMREDIKAKLEEFEVQPTDIAFIYFQKGDAEAKLRFKVEDSAKEAFKKLPGEEIEIKEAKVKVMVLEGDDESSFLKQCVEDMDKQKNKNRGHKRKGGFRGGRGGKRQRN